MCALADRASEAFQRRRRDLSASPRPVNVLPYSANGLPYGVNVLPYGTNALPYGANVLPYSENVLPYGANGLPYGANCLPYGANVLPHGANVLPRGLNAPYAAVLSTLCEVRKEFLKRFSGLWHAIAAEHSTSRSDSAKHHQNDRDATTRRHLGACGGAGACLLRHTLHVSPSAMADCRLQYDLVVHICRRCFLPALRNRWPHPRHRRHARV
jgi:hypothetical protein